MNYFADDSNLSTRHLHGYCPSAAFVQRTLLPNFRVVFRRYSTDMQGGISSSIEAPGELVHGLIFEVDAAEIEALDILEYVPNGSIDVTRFLSSTRPELASPGFVLCRAIDRTEAVARRRLRK